MRMCVHTSAKTKFILVLISMWAGVCTRSVWIYFSSFFFDQAQIRSFIYRLVFCFCWASSMQTLMSTKCKTNDFRKAVNQLSRQKNRVPGSSPGSNARQFCYFNEWLSLSIEQCAFKIKFTGTHTNTWTHNNWNFLRTHRSSFQSALFYLPRTSTQHTLQRVKEESA